MKIGLVLEGGAMRGMYTSGVLDTFLENDIEVDKIIGVSAGVLFGVNYLSKQKGRAIRYNKRFIKDKRYMGMYSLLKTGDIVGKDFTFYEIPYKLDVFDDETFKNSKTEFYAAVTNVETGEAEYLKIDSVLEQMEILRATSAMPYVSNFVELNGKNYLDGAIADSIPVEKCKAMGCDKIIVVLTRTIDYRKSDTESKFASMKYGDYPNLVKAIEQRHEMYNNTVEKIIDLENKKEIFVIRPTKDLHIKRIEKDIDKLQAMYDLGVSDTNDKLKELKEYLAD
ncbi:MAG: patatin-like phospholipase family protein [Clostridia bacterium]|nr:patatin-like phospholipase family protein [Clostridia bacterium]